MSNLLEKYVGDCIALSFFDPSSASQYLTKLTDTVESYGKHFNESAQEIIQQAEERIHLRISLQETLAFAVKDYQKLNFVDAREWVNLAKEYVKLIGEHEEFTEGLLYRISIITDIFENEA